MSQLSEKELSVLNDLLTEEDPLCVLQASGIF